MRAHEALVRSEGCFCVNFLLLSGKSKQKALYLFIHRYCSRFTHPEAWFSVSNCKYYRMHLF